MNASGTLIIRSPKPPRRRRAILAVLLLLAVWIEGCFLLGSLSREDRDTLLKFSHARHAKHANTCKDCHKRQPAQDMSIPTHAACAPCHKSAAEGQAAGKGCLLCHHTLTPKKAKRAERPDYSPAKFAHGSHSRVTCAKCHGEVDKARFFTKINYPKMEDCLACHFPGLSETSAANCAFCHSGMTAKTKPKSHQEPRWGKAHGPRSYVNPSLCWRCHTQSRECDACHRRERPQSHDVVFRTKTHGFRAMSNPRSCETCHRQDFCEACHRTTKPLSHHGSFSNRPWLHCAVCHLPVDEGNRCAACHREEPHSKVHAKSPPAALVAAGLITPTKPCLPCHFVSGGPPIPHPYNTVTPFECIQCHHLM